MNIVQIQSFKTAVQIFKQKHFDILLNCFEHFKLINGLHVKLRLYGKQFLLKFIAYLAKSQSENTFLSLLDFFGLIKVLRLPAA